jgi:hypothetical protein
MVTGHLPSRTSSLIVVTKYGDKIIMSYIYSKIHPEKDRKFQNKQGVRGLEGDKRDDYVLTKPSRVRRMILNLKPGDRIRISANELSENNARGVIETEVLEVQHSAGWYRVMTSCGTLKPHQPTDKYEVVEAAGIC